MTVYIISLPSHYLNFKLRNKYITKIFSYDLFLRYIHSIFTEYNNFYKIYYFTLVSEKGMASV